MLEAETGEEALSLANARKGAIDALVVDLRLPGKAGPAVADELRAVNPNAITIFISGYSREHAAREHLLPDGALFLQKPLDASDIARLLTREPR